ncbi:unnamed protein product [Meloidogyne enterolobii]|uniref:Uncharacterized protein n=1 Tax=Meloidogyne enterolobii TaxID=390850 RepID=A0ACB1ATE3_MELEN
MKGLKLLEKVFFNFLFNKFNFYKGSFGIAVLYKRKDDESFVILKEINLHELNNSERQMALNEVNLLSRLDHPHIIAFYDSFEEDGTLMIEMEYADGGTLSQLLSHLTEPLIESEIIDMFEQMCEGKPYNEKSDVWALGCCFYEMCTLNKAFDAENLPTLLNKIINSEYEPLKKIYSQEVRLLVREMLRISPQQRPASSQLLDQIAVSESHQLLLTMQGQVYSWGDNSFGQLGQGDKRKRQFPTLIESLESKDVYKVAAGKKFSLFCAGRGILLTVGRKLLFDNSDYLTKPKIVEELLTEDIVDICCGDEHAIALTVYFCGPDSTMLITNSGTILAMGSNKYNKLNLNKRAGFFKEMKKEQNTVQGKKQLVDDALLPTAVRPFPRRVVSASLGNNHSGVLLENGHVHLFGLNSYGELGTGSTLPFSDSTRPVKALINKACLVNIFSIFN